VIGSPNHEISEEWLELGRGDDCVDALGSYMSVSMGPNPDKTGKPRKLSVAYGHRGCA